jgi:preprotein translocase subunit YajC
MHLNVLNALLADAAATPPAAGQAGSPGAQPTPAQQLFGSPLIFIVLIFVMMYFIMIRPQSQRAKQQAKLIASLKSGDKIVTTGGIIGVVVTVKDKTVSLRSSDAKMEVTKASVVEILERGGDSSAS